MSEKLVFAEFEWKYYIFLSIKMGEWDLNILLFNYWNDFVLGLVEIYFHDFFFLVLEVFQELFWWRTLLKTKCASRNFFLHWNIFPDFPLLFMQKFANSLTFPYFPWLPMKKVLSSLTLQVAWTLKRYKSKQIFVKKCS